MAYFPETPKCDFCNNDQGCYEGNRNGGCHNCNTCNSSCQTLCQVGYQTMSQHPDVGSYPLNDATKNKLLKEVIVAKDWNTLIERLNRAERIGRLSSQGSNGDAETAVQGGLFKASHYNDIQKKLQGFNNASFSQVNVNDVITAARIQAIKTAYNNALFKNTVCDTCNQGENRCNCNCDCQCTCGCACPCPCPCPCPSPPAT